MKTYKEMIVWQKSFKLTIKIYLLTKKFPKEEMYGISNQMRRAAVSIPSNIAEGFSRKSRSEYKQFIRIAFASGAELETQMMLAKELNFINVSVFNDAWELLEEVMKMLNVLLERLTE